MRQLFLLLLHPTHIVKGPLYVSVLLIQIAVIGFAATLGLTFQHLYPRLLNKVPWLGFLRKFSLANWNPAFDLEYFLRGAGMALWIIGIYLVTYLPAHWAGRIRGQAFPVCYLAALATATPLLITSAIGFLFFYLHLSLGLFWLYGLVAGACLQATLLRELFQVPRALVVYLAPLVLAVQAYGCFRLLP
jgi:hypothetical protein